MKRTSSRSNEAPPNRDTRISRHLPLFVIWMLFVLLVFGAAESEAQSFVEYPGHPATYGDHVVANATWVGGPTTLVVSLKTDGTLHADGQGESQRTARNTLTFLPPRDPANPQNFDDEAMVAEYGERLPLLQQLAASGTSTLSYAFDQPLMGSVDLFLADLDQSDSAEIRAYDSNGSPLDMNDWILIVEGDLSDFKDTGTVFSPVVAPTPDVFQSAAAVRLDAVDDTNYNRSFGVLRSPPGVDLARIDIEFSGTRNSPSRAAAGNGSHVYVALSTVPEPTLPGALVTGLLWLAFVAPRLRPDRARTRRPARLHEPRVAMT